MYCDPAGNGLSLRCAMRCGGVARLGANGRGAHCAESRDRRADWARHPAEPLGDGDDAWPPRGRSHYRGADGRDLAGGRAAAIQGSALRSPFRCLRSAIPCSELRPARRPAGRWYLLLSIMVSELEPRNPCKQCAGFAPLAGRKLRPSQPPCIASLRRTFAAWVRQLAPLPPCSTAA